MPQSMTQRDERLGDARLRSLSDDDLALVVGDATTCLDLAEHAWESYALSPVQSVDRGHYLALAAEDARARWLAGLQEQARRRA